MPNFCVNRNSQPSGEHEVHDLDSDCKYLPDANNQIQLGIHVCCQSAVYSARAHYNKVDGCYYCVPECHSQ